MGTYRNTKQVRYKNKVYSSVSGLCRETCLHRSKIYRMIDRGEVVYVNRTTNRTTEPNRTTKLNVAPKASGSIDHKPTKTITRSEFLDIGPSRYAELKSRYNIEVVD